MLKDLNMLNKIKLKCFVLYLSWNIIYVTKLFKWKSSAYMCQMFIIKWPWEIKMILDFFFFGKL